MTDRDTKDVKETKDEKATREARAADAGYSAGRILIRVNGVDTSQLDFSGLRMISINGQPGTVYYKHPAAEALAIMDIDGDDVVVGVLVPLEDPAPQSSVTYDTPDTRTDDKVEDKAAAKR